MVSFKRRVMAAVLSVIMVISCFAGMTFSVGAETAGDYEYETIDSSTVKIKRYNGSDADVVIPAEIDGKKVTVIGEYSFCCNASLNKVSIPDGITDIEYGAFIGCSSLVQVNIPGSVDNIEFYALGECASLKEINVDESNGNYKSQNGVLFNKDMTALVVYPNSSGGDKYDIPDGVTEIYSHAFEGTEIKSVTIPGSVSVIGEKAFFECKNLKDAVMSDGIETIDEEAFAYCEALTEINVPDSVTDLGAGAFEGCGSLTSVKLSKNIACINEFVFSNCTALSEIEIPENVSDIYYGAFMNCDSLTSIEISKDVILIEDYAFGFSLNDDLDRIINWNFVIYGYADSAAELYAAKLGFRFVNVEGSDCKHKKTELKNAVEATCQHRGYTGDLVCLECGEIIAPGVKIFATGHRYVNGVCSVCGDIDPDYKSGLTSKNEQIKVNNETKEIVFTPASSSGMNASEFKSQFDGEISIGMDDNALISNGTKIKFGDSEFTVIVKGDVQADGKITASDARTILRISAKLDKADDAEMSAADVNGDGKVMAGEARQVLRFSAKLESTMLSA